MSNPQKSLSRIAPRELTNLSEQRMDLFRSDTSASSCGYGWLIVDDRNVIGNKVLLISKHAPLCVMFDHGEPYHDHLRAHILAQQYASQHPQHALCPSLLLATASLPRRLDEFSFNTADEYSSVPAFA